MRATHSCRRDTSGYRERLEQQLVAHSQRPCLAYPAIGNAANSSALGATRQGTGWSKFGAARETYELCSSLRTRTMTLLFCPRGFAELRVFAFCSSQGETFHRCPAVVTMLTVFLL